MTNRIFYNDTQLFCFCKRCETLFLMSRGERHGHICRGSDGKAKLRRQVLSNRLARRTVAEWPTDPVY